MNLKLGFVKQHGVKVILPLLLLTTACGEDASTTSQADTTMPDLSDMSLPESSATTIAPQVRQSAFTAGPRAQFDLEAEDTTGDNASLLLVESASEEGEVSDDASDPTAEGVAIAAQSAFSDKAAVPEPAGVMGLASAALGLVAIKRTKSPKAP